MADGERQLQGSGQKSISFAASCRFSKNDFDSAERTWRLAQQSARNAGDEFQYAAATNNLGMIQQRRSRCDESIPYFDQALQVWRKTWGRPNGSP